MKTDPPTSQPETVASQFSGGLGLRGFIILLGVLFLLTYSSLLWLDRTFIYRDFGAFGYPLAFQAQESWRAGEIPLWNPHSNCGLPFLAQWNTMALYPLSVFYCVLPVEWALSWFCILHLFLGGVGMFVLARRWFGGELGAAVAGVAFAFSGLAFNSLLWPNNAAALGWMPWVLLVTQRAALIGGKWIPIAALVTALQVLTGAPEVILQTGLLALLVILWPVGSNAECGWHIRLLRWFASMLLVAGLTAIQMLPFLELLQSCHRSSGFSGGVWPMPAWGWGSFLVPLLHCFSWESGTYNQPDQYWVSSYYLGAFPFVLAILGAVRAKGRTGLVLGCAALAVLILALGNAGLLYPLVMKLVPGGGLVRYPVKFVVAATLLLPLLAAHGIRWLESHPQPRSPGRSLLVAGVAAMAAMGALLIMMKLRPLQFDEFSVTAKNTLWRGVWLAVALAILWLLMKEAKAVRRLGFSLLLVAVLWLDLSTHAPALMLTAKTSALAPNLAMANGAPKFDQGQGRVMLTPEAKKFFFNRGLPDAENDFLGKRLGGFANANLLDHQPKVDGLYSLYPAWHYDLVSAIYNRTNLVPPALADVMAVSHQTSSNDVFSWTARPTALPIVTAGQSPEFLDATAIKEKVIAGDFDPRAAVLLDSSWPRKTTATNRANAQLKMVQFSAHAIGFEVRSDAPTWVVISQTWYPTWKAWVNRSPVPIVRANHAFQAIEIPAGTAHVRLACVDHKFQTGAAISGLSLLTCLFWWWRSRPRRQVA